MSGAVLADAKSAADRKADYQARAKKAWDTGPRTSWWPEPTLKPIPMGQSYKHVLVIAKKAGLPLPSWMKE